MVWVIIPWRGRPMSLISQVEEDSCSKNDVEGEEIIEIVEFESEKEDEEDIDEVNEV